MTGRCWSGVAAVVGAILLSISPVSHAWPRSGGSTDVRAELAQCRHPWGVPSPLLRRAIVRVTEARACAATDGLAQIVDDERRDALTRALAALAIGEIGCHGSPRERPGLREATIASLESASSSGNPATLRQAAVRALGRAGVTSAVPTLLPIRDGDPDPVVQFLAAQALTRITGRDHFDTALRDALVSRYISGAATYEVLEVTP